MRSPGLVLKTWALMTAVAIAAVSLAVVRVDSAPSAAVAIVGVCIIVLACRRYSEAVARMQAGGAMPGRLRKAGIALASATLAAATIGLSDLAFLAGYLGFLRAAYETVVASHWTPYDDGGYQLTGMIIGVSLALSVASSLRNTVWSPVSARPSRPWRRLWPIALALCIGGLLFVNVMRERYSTCRRMADYHADHPALPNGPNPKTAARHAWLKRWYERAAIRPWLPVHPDRIPPELQ